MKHKHISVKIDQKAYHAIRSRARAERRSIAKQIAIAIEAHCAKPVTIP